jgi:hypothetical protein
MSYDLKALKSRSAQSLMDVQAEATKMNAKEEYGDDDSFWQPSRGKDGNGFAIIRFLPPPFIDGPDAQRIIRYFRHSFVGPVTGEWYIENCLSTLKQKDPVNDLTRVLYKSDEHDKSLAGKYKRKTTYVTNILIIQDDLNPQNNGKVKKFKFGVTIWKKIEAALTPKIGRPINPSDFWLGHNFGLATKTVGEWANYDDSAFDPSPSVIAATDEEIDAIWKAEYSLTEFLDPKNYKDFDTLKAKLDQVLGFSYEERGCAANVGAATPANFVSGNAQPLRPIAPAVATQLAPATGGVAQSPATNWVPTPPAASPTVAASPVDDTDMAFLKSLAAKST